MTLPGDLIVEILSWLPVKSLLRFKSVNKSIKSFINNPKFVKLQLQRSHRDPYVILTNENVFRDFVSIYIACPVRYLMENPSSPVIDDHGHRLEPQVGRIVFVSSCNGLICLCGLVGDEVSSYCNRFWVYLWNPATGKQTSTKYPCLLPALFDNNPAFGFGYDNLHDTYKVVAVTTPRMHHSSAIFQKNKVKVYNTGDNCWTNIENFPTFESDGGTYLSGTFNWLAFQSYKVAEQQRIISLDLGNETYRQFSLPINETIAVDYSNIGVFKDCLCFYYVLEYEPCFVMWHMKEFGVQNSWTQLWNIITGDYIEEFIFDLPLSLGIDENGDTLVFVDDEPDRTGRVVIYNRRNKSNNAVEPTEISIEKGWTPVTGYFQSLVSP